MQMYLQVLYMYMYVMYTHVLQVTQEKELRPSMHT